MRKVRIEMRFVKIMALGLSALLVCSCASAEGTEPLGVTATGILEAQQSVKVTAPFSGVLLPFETKIGDRVEKDSLLFALDTVKIYAPCDGKAGAVFAEVGDDAQTVIARYGSLAAVEPNTPFMLDADTTGAYDESANKILHVGETLYFKSSDNKRIKGEGRVVDVNGDKYRVEVTAGDPEINEKVTLYRDPLYVKESNVGKGTCGMGKPVGVTGAGRIVKCVVKGGDKVKAGDLLFEAVGADAAPGARAELTAPVSGVVSGMQVQSGQQVYKGQLLCTVDSMDALQVSCDVDEVDLGRLKIGDQLSVSFDALPGESYEGTVLSISSMGAVKQNAAYYTVKLSVVGTEALRLGMSATVYLK